MAQRTQLFQMLPWSGGVNTSIDEALIPANQLTVADNVVFDTRGSKRIRDGINLNYDNQTARSANVIGIHDYWYGDTTKTQKRVFVTSDRKVYSEVDGLVTELTVGGEAWTGTLTTCSMLTFNNLVFIAVDGAANVMKQWSGSGNVSDVSSATGYTTVSRSSSGTTKTLKLSATVTADVGMRFVVSGVGGSGYNGTWTLASVAGDTITFVSDTASTEGTTADTGGSIGLTAPLASILREHQGRIFCNDKSRPDRLHYSAVADHTTWGGTGDSGAIDIGVGDGDPEGLTGISPTFKGTLFVGKRSKLYRISGYEPESWQVETVSSGVGVVSHNSFAAVDQDDLFFVSEKGVHSIQATQSYGDFASVFVSTDIQRTFNDEWSRSRLKYVQAGYVDSLNCVAFAVTETSGTGRVNTDTTENNAIWLYNIPFKAWFRWPDISCQALTVCNDADRKRLYLGTSEGRLSKTMVDDFYDTDTAGDQAAVRMRLVSGLVFVDESPYTVKGFKRFVLYYRPTGTHNITCQLKIDNFTLDAVNTMSFSETGSSALLGPTGSFTLGVDTLGYSAVLGPSTRHTDGYGRGVRVTIESNSVGADVEIQGFGIEYEPAGSSPETFIR
jgi:hypothetical protein